MAAQWVHAVLSCVSGVQLVAIAQVQMCVWLFATACRYVDSVLTARMDASSPHNSPIVYKRLYHYDVVVWTPVVRQNTNHSDTASTPKSDSIGPTI